MLARERSDDISAAIDKAIASMNFVVRPIARSRLGKTNPPYDHIRIGLPESQIELTLGANKTMRMPADGGKVKWTRLDGEVIDISASSRPQQIVQTLQAKDGQRVNAFKLSADGKTLTLEVWVTSERLPEAVHYSLTYLRASAHS